VKNEDGLQDARIKAAVECPYPAIYRLSITGEADGSAERVPPE
jgi:hypothetical protein